MGKVMCAIGLMSGTSMDGVDVVLIETDGEDYVRRYPSETYSYLSSFRSELAKALGLAMSIKDRAERSVPLREIEQALTKHHVEAVQAYLRDVVPEKCGHVEVIGFHGHTVLHRPEKQLTVQLGDGAQLARETGIPVVYDLRAADVAAGGQGAPLACIYHRALAGSMLSSDPSSDGSTSLRGRPVAILNIGGVANVTWIAGEGGIAREDWTTAEAGEPSLVVPDPPHLRAGSLIGFDVGPGNALLDDWAEQTIGQVRDENGQLAAKGRVDVQIRDRYLAHPYFDQPPPKSLDRNAFALGPVANMTPENGAATLAAVTVEAIAISERYMPQSPEAWIICGGGRHNATLMDMLCQRSSGDVFSAEYVGFDGDSVEAEAWAYLAVRSMIGLPISFPGTTGAPEPMTGGIRADP